MRFVQKKYNHELTNQLIDVKFPATFQQRYKIQELAAMLWSPSHHDFFVTKYIWLLEWVQKNYPKLFDELRALPVEPNNQGGKHQG